MFGLPREGTARTHSLVAPTVVRELDYRVATVRVSLFWGLALGAILGLTGCKGGGDSGPAADSSAGTADGAAPALRKYFHVFDAGRRW